MSKTTKDRLVYVGTILFYGAIAYGVYSYIRTPAPVATNSTQVVSKTNGGVVHIDGLNATIEK